MEDKKNQLDSLTGCFVRLLWMFLGNAAMALMAISIAQGSPEKLLLKDAVFFILAGLSVLARYLDVRYLHGQTSDGMPATPAHFRKYAAVVVPVYFSVLLMAHLLRFVFAK
jgi:hypothetical protein